MTVVSNEQPCVVPPRRTFLAGLGALGASALFPGCATVELGGETRPTAVPPHFVSPAYSAALKARGRSHTQWSVQKSLEDMDKSGISTSITSLIQPAVWFGDVPLGRKLAREANEYAT